MTLMRLRMLADQPAFLLACRYILLPEGGGFQLLRRMEQQLRFAVHGPG